MVVVRHILSLACVLGTVVLAACEKNEAAAPTPVANPAPTPSPTPSPTPAPTAPTFSVSGTIFETEPTASTRVPDAEVQLTGGVATGSVADGTFTIPNVANGTYTLRIAKSAYETQTRTVTVNGGNVIGLAVSLMPAFRLVNQDVSRELKPGDPSCQGTARPCHVYVLSSHHGGEVRAFVAWNAKIADFDFEWWCKGELVEKRGQLGNDHDEILPRIGRGETCEVHLLHSGEAMRYNLYLTWPY
jgi:hypothetical protein